MSEFLPYHEGMPAYVDLLDPYDDHYLVRLGVLADLASRLKVPKEGRAKMRAIFAEHASEIDGSNHWLEDEAAKAIASCYAVCAAMDDQDVNDAAMAQQSQEP